MSLDKVHEISHHEHQGHHSSHHLPTHMPALPGNLEHSYPYHEHHDHSPSDGKAVSGFSEDHAITKDDDAESLERTNFRNPWDRIRYKYNLREYFGEMLGTMLLIIFGTGVDCQVVLSKNVKGSYLSISFGWGIGVMCGVYAAGGISGGHINPVVTICLSIFRGFPKRKVPGYILSQVFGAFLGALIVQGVYSGALNEFEGGDGIRTFQDATSTAALFFTAPAAYMTNVACFFSEFMDTAILIIIVLAIGDPNNSPPPPGMAPIVLLFLILGIGASLGWQTAYCLNPARDFGPRLALSILGYPRTIWTARHAYWIWTPVIATTCGGITGACIYDTLLYEGEESPINAIWGNTSQGKIKDAEKSA